MRSPSGSGCCWSSSARPRVSRGRLGRRSSPATSSRGRPSGGRIILLNGASSSGKTTIARSLQGLFEEPWLRVGVDVLRTVVPPGWTVEADGADSVLRGMRRAVRAMADAGNDVVVDDVILERAWLTDWAAVLDGVPAWLVGVRCPAAVV